MWVLHSFGILSSVLCSKNPNGSFPPSNSISSARVDFIPCQGPLLFVPLCIFFLGSLLFRPQVSFFYSQKAICVFCCQDPCLVCLSLSWDVAPTKWAVLVCICVHACRCSHLCVLCECMCVHVCECGWIMFLITKDTRTFRWTHFPHRSAFTYVVRGQVWVEIVNSCEKMTIAQEWKINTCHCPQESYSRKISFFYVLALGDTEPEAPALCFTSWVSDGGLHRPSGETAATRCISGVKPIRAWSLRITFLP